MKDRDVYFGIGNGSIFSAPHDAKNDLHGNILMEHANYTIIELKTHIFYDKDESSSGITVIIEAIIEYAK
jgi:hypothetical protein